MRGKRDLEVRFQLREAGIRVIVIWECAIRMVCKTSDGTKELIHHIEAWLYEDDKRNQLLAFTGGNNSALESRIHIVDNNIFEAFTDIATTPNGDEHTENVMEYVS